MERLSIQEAAQRFGVSAITIRRRIKRGTVQAEREPTPAGFTYRVLLPLDDEPRDSLDRAIIADYRATIEHLQRELDLRTQEIQRLQELLAREQETVREITHALATLRRPDFG